MPGKPELAARMENRLVSAGMPERERAALAPVLERLLDSETGRRLSWELLRESAPITISFSEVAGSTVVFDGDRLAVQGPQGQVITSSSGALDVQLSSAFLSAEDSFLMERGPCVLAHEMLGHALEMERARRAGVAEVLGYLDLDEFNARIIGNIVCVELGFWNDAEANELDNIGSLHRALVGAHAHYALTMPVSGLYEPVVELRRTLVWLEKFRRDLDAKERDWREAPESAKKDYVIGVEIPDDRASLKDARAAVVDRIALFETSAGRDAAEQMGEMAPNPYFDRLTDRAYELHFRMQRLYRERSR